MRTSGNDIECKIDDITLCYNDAGEGTIPLIFIHGFPFDKSMWKEQFDFAKTFTRVITYDLRGFGKSSTGGQSLSINLFADDLIRFMDLLEIPRAILCGLSMGGYIALNAVDRYKARFAAIILADTQCIADTEEAKAKRFKTIEQIEQNGLSEFAASFIKNIFCKETIEHKKEEVLSIHNTILSTSPETIISTLKALAERLDTCSTLNEITVPVLIVCGIEDSITPYAQSEKMHSLIKNSTIQSILHAAHLSNVEQPVEFNRNLKSFIDLHQFRQ